MLSLSCVLLCPLLYPARQLQKTRHLFSITAGPHRTERQHSRNTHGDGKPREKETHFTEHLGNGNLMSDKEQSHFFFPCSFLPFSRSFWRLHKKKNPVAMVVEFLNKILGLYFGGLLLLHVTHVLSGRIGFFVWVSEGLAALKVLCYASLSNYKRKFAWIRTYYMFFVFGLAFAFPPRSAMLTITNKKLNKQ